MTTRVPGPAEPAAEKRTFYITTPIYYPSDKLHIGHSYTTVAADAMARYKRLNGFDVMFLTGTDEHGQKIQKRAVEEGVEPQTFVDRMVASVKDLWSLMNISYDRFIRTTDRAHEQRVQAIFQQLYDQGDIYLDRYEGWYCTPCESFWTETQLVDGKCPDCGREVHRTEEESYFFRLSKYQDRIIKLYEDCPEFIQPPARKHEMLNNFLRPGLEDLAVSRTSFDWGVRVPFDDKHVIYVWVDALVNYITALGYPDHKEDGYDRFWPADVQLVGKEIVRFHTIIWPALLMALDLPVPQQVFGHGWLLIDDGKMSKSVGNVVDPVILCDRYGVDAVRYFLLREIAFGSDGNFSNRALINRINSDLANDLGNLVSRTTSMIKKYFAGSLPDEREATDYDRDLVETALSTGRLVAEHMDSLNFNLALQDIWTLIGRSNKYIDETRPWILAKDEGQNASLANVLYHLAAALRVVAVLLQPFMPTTAQAIFEALNITEAGQKTWSSATDFTAYRPAGPVAAARPLFPRIDVEEELARLEAERRDRQQSSNTPPSGDRTATAGKQTSPKNKEAGDSDTARPAATLDFNDFLKLQLQVGTITACAKVEGSDKLLCSTVDLGIESRQVVSGIAAFYEPVDLIGRQVVLVANLKPRKIFGQLSQGMLLCAEDSATGTLRLLCPDEAVAAGSEIS